MILLYGAHFSLPIKAEPASAATTVTAAPPITM